MLEAQSVLAGLHDQGKTSIDALLGLLLHGSKDPRVSAVLCVPLPEGARSRASKQTVFFRAWLMVEECLSRREKVCLTPPASCVGEMQRLVAHAQAMLVHTGSLVLESRVLERLLYRNSNQMRQSGYFHHLVEVRRHLSKLPLGATVQVLTKVSNQEVTPDENVITSLRDCRESLLRLIEAIEHAAISLGQAITLTHLMHFTAVTFAILSRLYALCRVDLLPKLDRALKELPGPPLLSRPRLRSNLVFQLEDDEGTSLSRSKRFVPVDNLTSLSILRYKRQRRSSSNSPP